MKYLKMALIYLVWTTAHAEVAQSQSVLSSATSRATPQQGSVSLQRVLKQLENTYGVSIISNAELVTDKTAKMRSSAFFKLEEALNWYLSPHGLDYRKAEDGFYYIVRKPERKSQAGLPNAITFLNNPLSDDSHLPAAADFRQQNISGTVTDGETGDPLPGVSIVEKGSQNGTMTDVDGHYSLDLINDDGVLAFSFMGFLSQEVAVSGRSLINVSLEPDVRALDEVVVVGYGTQKKVNVIGSVSQISSKDLENRPVSQLSQALAGQMPGVTVIQRTGRPGASEGTIRVRGVGSFGATPGALVLVDGIPGTLNEINPEDVQSVSVLKDASSAAIYGARSANGVILVTTKNGTSGKATVGYNGYIGVSRPTEYPEFVNSWEYAEMYNIASGSNSYTAEEIAAYKSQSDPDLYPNTDFLGRIFSRDGIQTAHNVTVTGGQNSHRYFISAGVLNQQGIVEKNDYRRYNIRLNLENGLGERLTLNTRLSGSFEERNEPQTSAVRAANNNFLNQLIQNALRYPAIYLGQAANGDFGLGPESQGTPVAWIASDSYLTNPVSKGAINMRLAWRPLDGMTLSAIGGYHIALLETRSFLGSQRMSPDVFFPQSTLDRSSDKETFRTAQLLAEYGRSLGDHQLDLLLGYSFESQRNTFFNGYRQDFPSNDYTVPDMGGADNQQSGGYDAEWAIQSFFTRFKYNFKEKYLLEATLRYDGSSRFPEDSKYALFPSAAIGWRMSEEPFLKAASWISDLKLKASYGVLGNQNIGNYPYQSVLGSGRNYPFGGGVSTGAAYLTYRDANIRWESTQTADIGLESGFWDGRLTFAATYFVRNTTDILFKPSASVSSVLGADISETNTGEARNAGWEFEVGHMHTSDNFTYSVRGNFSIIQNEVVTLGLGNVEQPNGFVGNGSTLFIGYPMEMYYGYLSDGVFLDQEDVGNWADQRAVTPRPQAGDIRYKDISGPEGKPDGEVTPAYDRTYLGSRIPKYTFGLSLGVQYKSFDLSAFLQGVAGVKGLLNNYAGWAFFNLGNIQRWQMEGRFDPENPVRYPEYPRLEVITNSGTPNTQLSDFWSVNASYLRVKNLQLGYTIPKSTLKTIGIESVRAYLSAENLFSFDSYRKGWDPEINTAGNYYPILATYTLGVNIKF